LSFSVPDGRVACRSRAEGQWFQGCLRHCARQCDHSCPASGAASVIPVKAGAFQVAFPFCVALSGEKTLVNALWRMLRYM